MTTQFLTLDIAHDEAPGGKPILTAYPDPLSPLGRALTAGMIRTHGLSGDPWTIGFGSTGSDIVEGTTWTAEQCVARRDADIAKLVTQCSHFPWWDTIGDVRQDVFIQMGYQMGFNGLLKFVGTLAAAARGAWGTVAADMRLSLWDRQTHGRAERLADQAETGVRIPQPYDHEAVQPVPQVKEPFLMSLVTSAFHFVFSHAFAAAARQAATSDPVAAAAGITAVQSTPMPQDGSPNSPAGIASGPIKQLEDDLNALVCNFVKATVDQLPVVGGVAEVTGLDQQAADAAKALLVLGEQHALTYMSALFSGHHLAVNAVTKGNNGA